MKKILWSLLQLSVYVVCGQSRTAQSTIADKHYKTAIQKAERYVIDSLQVKQDIPGISVCVGNKQKILWAQGFGYADLENNVKVTTTSRFRVGSVSKMLTVMAVGRLYQQGKLDLDAPVQKYVPAFPEKNYPITSRQLAGHLSGIRHYRKTDPLNIPKRYKSVTESLSIFKDDTLLFKPGTASEYSSYGYNLLSAVVESAAGVDFLSYMCDSIFLPAGLTNTAPDYSDSIVHNRVRFYEHSKSRLVNASLVDNSYKWAGGGFVSTPSDLVTMGQVLLNHTLLDAKTVELLFASQQLENGKKTNVGIGWRSGADAKGRRIIHHGGLIDGGRTFVLIYPDNDLIFAITANMSGVSINFKEAEAITDCFFAAQGAASPGKVAKN